MTAPAIAGTGGQTNTGAQPGPGSQFGLPKYSTQPRFVLDNQNGALGATPSGTSPVAFPTGKLDQLDVVRGIKINMTYNGTWTNTGSGLAVSPFFPATLVSQVTFKLQAAYNSFNLPGTLAAIMQAYRPMWGGNQIGVAYPNAFVQLGKTNPTFGTAFNGNFTIDIPLAVKFDEYFELNATGDPVAQLYNTWVNPYFMAAQARSVVPTITLATALTTSDLLGGPVSRPGSDTTSTFATTGATASLSRDAWWTANNPAANPPQFSWMYTRDYFTQPTQGQGSVSVLLLNTGVSLGQVLSVCGFVWDPAANSGLGAIVPYSSIQSIQLVTGGSLQNRVYSAQAIQDYLQSMYGFYNDSDETSWPSGIFVLDFARDPNGAIMSNANAINTYLVNGVSVIVTFKSGLQPSATATVYLGVEALKLATS